MTVEKPKPFKQKTQQRLWDEQVDIDRLFLLLAVAQTDTNRNHSYAIIALGIAVVLLAIFK